MQLRKEERQGVALEVSPALAAAGMAHGFTGRAGGVSQGIYASLNLGVNRGDDRQAVEENYRRVCAALGVELAGVTLSSQVHGDSVRIVTSADRGQGLTAPAGPDCDGLITDVPGITLTVFGADCLTVLLCDPVRRVIAAVHAGWRGTTLGIVERAVEKMVDHYGCKPEDILAALGPCIDKCCFETGEDVPNAMTAALGAWVLPYLTIKEDGKFLVDLKGINRARLERAGVLPEHIDCSDSCTLCQHEEYWSHRYTKGERGSQVALICLDGVGR